MKSKTLPIVASAAFALVLIAIPMHRSTGARRGTPLESRAVPIGATRTPRPDSGSSFPDVVVLRPLPVVRNSAMHEWTGGDMMNPGVITKVAHNPDEAIRMIEENDRIRRRQLVYRRETAAATVRRVRAAGQSLKTLMLPGLDGEEFEFEILTADLQPSGEKGTFAGRLAGKPNSMVTLAFEGDREAFSVSSPDENLHLQADPREPGEIIVKGIDPATYIQGGCGTLGHNP